MRECHMLLELLKLSMHCIHRLCMFAPSLISFFLHFAQPFVDLHLGLQEPISSARNTYARNGFVWAIRPCKSLRFPLELAKSYHRLSNFYRYFLRSLT